MTDWPVSWVRPYDIYPKPSVALFQYFVPVWWITLASKQSLTTFISALFLPYNYSDSLGLWLIKIKYRYILGRTQSVLLANVFFCRVITFKYIAIFEYHWLDTKCARGLWKYILSLLIYIHIRFSANSLGGNTPEPQNVHQSWDPLHVLSFF